MVGDYRKLSTHNQLRQEPEIKTRVKMFKGKGQWLTTLLVAVGAAIAVQGQTTAHAATTDSADTNPEIVKANDSGVAAAKTGSTLKLATSAKTAVNNQDGWSAKAAATTTAVATLTATAKPSADTDASAKAVPKNTDTTTTTKVDTDTTSYAGADAETAIKSAATTVDQGATKPAVTDSQNKAPVGSDKNTATQNASAPAASDSKTTLETGSTDTVNTNKAATTTTEQNSGSGSGAKGLTPENNSSTPKTVAKPQFKTAVDAAVATQADALTWTTVTDPTSIALSRNIQSDGKSYTFVIKAGLNPNYSSNNTGEKWGYPLFNNVVTDDADSQTTHTYCYVQGDTSTYYKRDLNASATDYEPLAFPENMPKSVTRKYEEATAADGTPYLRLTTEDGDDQLTIIETVSIDSSGAFNHTVSVQNNSTSSLNNVKFGTLLDTMLDGNDQIPIVSNGDGSAHITSATDSADGLTLYLTPTDNDTLTVGEWKSPRKVLDSGSPFDNYGDMLSKTSVMGTANGTTMVQGVDTGAQYETPALSLAPGASTTYSYSEHLYTNPIVTGTINVKYQDLDGGATLKPDTTTGGVVGSPFVLSSDAKTISGYTYDHTEGNVTNFTKDTQTVTLLFKKNPPAVTTQTATITYEDVTENNATLGAVDTVTGDSGSTSDYSSATRIQGYEDKGYTLVDDGTANGIIFDNDDSKDQPFVVKLAHTIVDVTPKDPHDADPKLLSTTATRVINYVNTSDPTKVPEPATITQTATLTRTGKKDLVTGDVTYTDWTAGTVDSVVSPTITGYTPDTATVAGASFSTPDVNGQPSATVTVTYTAADETQQFQYVDDNEDGANVGNPVSESGKNGASKMYAAVAPTGYVLADGQDSTIDYTFKPSAPLIKIHLVHDVVTVTPQDPHDADPKLLSTTATRVINYVNTDDPTKVPEPAMLTQTATLTRTGKEDLITKDVDYSDWTAGTVDSVVSPTITGYTADTATVAGASFSTPDVNGKPSATVTVTYTANDVTTTLVPEGPNSKPLTPKDPKTPATVTGKPGTPISSTDYPDVPGYTPDENQNKKVPNEPGDTIITYTPDTQKVIVSFVDNAGNTVIPDQTLTGKTDDAIDHSSINIQTAMNKGYTLSKDGTVGATFDNKTDKNQTLKIVLVPIEHASVTTTLVPEGPSGQPLTPTDPKTPTIVTGTPGDPINVTDYPDVPGYTPDENQNKKVPNEPGDTIITYTPDTQKVVVSFVDNAGNTVIPDQILTGKTDDTIDHSSINIQTAMNEGYTLSKDGTIGATFDNNTDKNQTLKVVLVPIEHASVTTTLVPEGHSGQPLTPTDPKTPTIVTGTPGDPISVTDYPEVPGYTPNENQNKKVPNEPGETVITYTPNKQTAVVTYVDESGNQLITPDQTLTGDSDTAINHSQFVSNIQNAIDQGLVLISDGTVGAKFDHNDDQPQKFTLVFGQVPKAKLTTTIVPKDPNGDPLTPTTPKQVTGFPGDPISVTDYPEVPGYTPNENQNKKVPNEPGETTVEYTPDTQTATIVYVDGDGNPIIPNQPIADKSDTPVDHSSIQFKIQTVINQGYNLVSDGTVGKEFDHDDDKTQIFTVTFTKIPARQTTTPGNPGGYVPTPPADDTNTGEPGLPSTFGETTPNEPGQVPSGDDKTPNEPGQTPNGGEKTSNEPGLPSTLGDASTGNSTGKAGAAGSAELAATGQTKQSQAQLNADKAATSKSQALPQTGDEHATGLAWLGATLMMMLLGLVDRRRKLDC